MANRNRSSNILALTTIMTALILFPAAAVTQGAEDPAFGAARDSAEKAAYTVSKVQRWLHEVALKKIEPDTGRYHPEKPGVNYLTARGFTMLHAATPWAPPTAEQIGLLGTHWSKEWVIEGNVFLMGSAPAKLESDPIARPAFAPDITLVNERNAVQRHITLDRSWGAAHPCRLVTTELLGKARIPDLPYEQPDGSPVHIDTDYFGRKRDSDHPSPGPFELSEDGKQMYQVWPVTTHE
jgi:hypothetical protein